MGTLYIVATPIGNLEDITIRAIKTLFSVDYIACEDTRVTSLLLDQISQKYTSILYSNVVKPKLISYYDEIEFKRVPEIIGLLENGKNIALVSDSGTPLVSDPGFKLVSECIKRNVKIVSIPGSSSIIAALTLSGLPTNQFLFLGYLPNKSTKRINLLENLKALRHLGSGPERAKRVEWDSPDGGGSRINPTIIFFEAPHRLKESLEDIKEVFGDIEIVICRELTKIHEEVWRGKISDALYQFSNSKGELVILL